MEIYFSLDKKLSDLFVGSEDIFFRKSQVYEEKNDYFIDMKVRLIFKKYILLMKKI
ncbi:hypothetical protein bcgnr5398_01190 [Bacillus cereus]